MNIQWNAEGYTKNFSFVHEYGNDLIGLIDRENCSSVLDLGCGNGALTKKLSDAGFQAFGLDASPDLLKIARENHPQLTFYEGDATCFHLPQRFDAVFSNAVFHWIDREKQPDMMKCVFEALNPGGQFVFELGGWQNNAKIHAALKEGFDRRGLPYKIPFYFPTIGEYASLMEKAGFKVTYAVLFDRMTELQGGNGLYDWLSMFIKTPFTGLSEDIKEAIFQEACRSLKDQLYFHEKWHSDYVRLRCKAVKLE